MPAEEAVGKPEAPAGKPAAVGIEEAAVQPEADIAEAAVQPALDKQEVGEGLAARLPGLLLRCRRIRKNEHCLPGCVHNRCKNVETYFTSQDPN